MTEREVLMAALAVALAAAWAMPISGWVVAAAVAVAIAARQPSMVIVALCLLVSSRAAVAERGLQRVAGPVEGTATLVSDPQRQLGGVVADVRIDGSRLRATFVDADAAAVGRAAMGQEVELAGRTAALRGSWAWRASRHLAGSLTVSEVRGVHEGAWWWRAVNSFREVIADGTVSLSPEHRSLFDGIVLGDDRAQSDLARHRFRSAGLSHLLAVSGQNVAFALLVVSPLLRRWSLTGRWVASMIVLAGFVLLTRLEPSVLRAACMAGVTVSAGWWGRISTAIRTLAVSVIALLVLDPLLVWSMGFRLSVAATAALVWSSQAIAGSLTGPRWLTDSLGVSLAAQMGTALLLVALAGTVPLFGPLINVLAVPVAGWLMVWGLVSAPVAGLLGGPIATALCWPTRVMLWALEQVAVVGGASSWPRVGWVGAVAMTVGIALLAHRSIRRERTAPIRWTRRRVAVVSIAVVSVGALAADVVVGAPDRVPPTTILSAPGVRVWRHQGVTVMALDARASSRIALDALLRVRVSAVDLVVVTGGGLRTSGVVLDLRRATRVAVVMADPAVVRDAVALRTGPITVGPLRFDVRRVDRRWRVDPAGTSPRHPPLGSRS